MMGKLKIGVFGAGRGSAIAKQLKGDPDAELVAVCDKFQPALDKCRKRIEAVGLTDVVYYHDFEDFFVHDLDAVILANYAYQHAPFAIRLLDSGRHVLSEVLTCATLKEAVELIEAVERSGKIYAYGENYGYTPVHWEMRRRYRNGDIGELMYAEGEYIHDCTSDPQNLWHFLTYGERDHWRNQKYSTFYCTHSLGPILQMTGLRPVKVTGYETRNMPYYREVGCAHACAGMELVTLENGAIVKSLHGGLKHTKTQGGHFVLNGDKGGLRNARDGMMEVYIEDENVPYDDRFQTYKPPVIVDGAEKSGHGGADFYLTYYFIRAILGDEEARKNTIDVYTAVDMCIPGILAYRSIVNGNIPIEVPNLRDPEQRDAYRNDTFCTFKDVAGDMWVPNNIYDSEPIPDEVYERERLKWEEYLRQQKNV